jgi:hypothetical protein
MSSHNAHHPLQVRGMSSHNAHHPLQVRGMFVHILVFVFCKKIIRGVGVTRGGFATTMRHCH